MPEELLARLQNLENSYYGDKNAAREKQFFDTYGSRFSNNRGLGLAILNELDARGIDTSAADEAVTQILDQLRTECNEIIESIKDVQQAAIDNAQKVEAIQEVVSNATAANPEAAPDAGAAPMPPVPEVPVDAGIDAQNPEGEFNPDEIPAPSGEEMPPEPAPGGEEVPSEPAPGGEEASSEEPAPDDELSDIRTKRIKKMKDNWGKTRAQKKKEEGKKDSWKPDSGILSACSGGTC